MGPFHALIVQPYPNPLSKGNVKDYLVGFGVTMRTLSGHRLRVI
jgi:hypothetical protein